MEKMKRGREDHQRGWHLSSVLPFITVLRVAVIGIVNDDDNHDVNDDDLDVQVLLGVVKCSSTMTSMTSSSAPRRRQ